MCGRACRGTCAAAGGVKVLAGEGGGGGAQACTRGRWRTCAGGRVGVHACARAMRARVPERAPARALSRTTPRVRIWVGRGADPPTSPPWRWWIFYFFTCPLALVDFDVLGGLFFVEDFLAAAGFAPCAPKKSTTSTKRPPRTNANTAANEFFFKNPPGGEKRSSFGPLIGQAPP